MPNNLEKSNQPLVEGIIPNTNNDKSAPPAVPYGITPPQAGFTPSQGNIGQGAYGTPPGSYPPPPGSYVPTPTYGPGTQSSYGPPQGAPISSQPLPQGTTPAGPHGWMTIPQNVPNCPPGLEYLTMIDQLVVHQEVELLEIITKYETENRFSIHNSLGQKMYSALEGSDAFMRNCCGSYRPFDMKILDNYGKPIIYLNRPFACKSCCCPCWLQKLEVSSPPGTLIGTVEQEWSFWVPHFAIKNASGDVVLRIAGPYCTMDCCGDVDFQVLTADGSNQVGKISKKWAGYAQETFTDADNFGINFPMDLDVRMKAVMLGACFLIDMMYYERSGKQNRANSAAAGRTGNTTINRV